MIEEKRWLLPEGVEELLPPQAELLERARAQILEMFYRWGYELVATPLVEYIESLLIGRGDDLDLQTYKLIDQLNGRLMGVRADITPQVARIDARHLLRQGPTRLCYAGHVLHTRAGGLDASREPLQVGAELYGHAGVEGDIEVIHLMADTLTALGVDNVHVDLGHVGIFRALARKAGLDPEQEAGLFKAMQRKAKSDMQEVLTELALTPDWREAFMALVDLNGDASVLTEARRVLKRHSELVAPAIDALTQIADHVQRRLPELPLHFDLAELRGYHYKSGILFAAFVPGHGQELARGGRYDNFGRVYGRARPATGFSVDLKTLIEFSRGLATRAAGILAPFSDDPSLDQTVRALRNAGERIVWDLPGHPESAVESGCDRILVRQGGQWQVMALSQRGEK